MGMPSRRTNNFSESGRGLGHVTPTIFGIRSNISLKLLELETSNLIHSFVWVMPSRRPNKFPWKWAWPRLRDPTIFDSTVGYPSDSLASCFLVVITMAGINQGAEGAQRVEVPDGVQIHVNEAWHSAWDYVRPKNRSGIKGRLEGQTYVDRSAPASRMTFFNKPYTYTNIQAFQCLAASWQTKLNKYRLC